jgi:hypothetical protein
MENNISKIEPTSFDEELIKSLGSNQGLKILNPDAYFSFIEENLKIHGSMAVGGELIFEKSSIDSVESWTKSITEAFVKYFIDQNIQTNSEVVILGDNMINYAYSISTPLFLTNIWKFLSIPQDTYIILNSTVFQYTFEDELYVFNIN